MAKKKYEESNIQAIADSIREKTGTETTYKTSKMADGVSEVYEAGKKAEYDAFWDAYQQNGKRNTYSGAFAGSGWCAKTFKPKYDMKNFTSASRMFNCFALNVGNYDLVELLKTAGVTIDFSSVTNAEYTFYVAGVTHLPKLDFSKVTTEFAYTLGSGGLITVDELILSDSGTQKFRSTFSNKLANIKISGVIGRDISFSASPLTVESMKSIITCLKDYSGTDGEFTYTVTFKASAFEALEAEGATAEYNGVACTWAEFIDNKKWNLVKA